MLETTYPFAIGHDQVKQLHGEDERSLYVNQGYAQVSTDGTLLDGDRFIPCLALILQNEGTSEALFAHIDDWHLTKDQVNKINSLSGGKYSATFVNGTLGNFGSDKMVDPKISHFTEIFSAGGKRILSIKPDIDVDSGNFRWAISYNPVTRRAKILTFKDRVVSVYNIGS